MESPEIIGDQNDLVQMFRERMGGGSSLDISDHEEGGSVPPPRSPTALQLDEWSMRRGQEVLHASPRMREMFGVLSEDQHVGAEHQERFEQAATATADFHAAAFEPEPQLVDEKVCKNKRIHQYMRNLMETPEFQALHAETQLDEAASELAAGSFAEQWVKLCQQQQPEDEFRAELQALGAAGKALASATSHVEDFRDTQAALGIGGNGGGSGKIPSAVLAGMFQRVRGSERLKRICELAGRYRRFAQAQQRKKVLHGRDDAVGVVLDGDLGRLLPHEMAMIDDPDLELDLLRRLVERQCMCREYRGIESKAKGPIVVVVDESGSMNGEPIATAKAMALALAWVARHQKRWCALVGFSGGTEGTFCVIPPGKDNPAELMTWLEHFYGGGTTCDVPLAVLPCRWEELGCPKGKTDIVILTDAQVNVPDEIRQSFIAFKQRENVKLISLVIGDEPGDLAAVSDRVHRVKSLALEEDGVADAMTI